MALYIAGECFENADWRERARQLMAKAVERQDPAGFWSEHSGPVIGYNLVYVEALGIYYAHSQTRWCSRPYGAWRASTPRCSSLMAPRWRP